VSQETKPKKDASKDEVRYAVGPGWNKMKKTSKLSTCPKCGKDRFVTEPGMEGTKHCPDCGYWRGLKEWTIKKEATD